MLQLHGYRTLVAANADEALELCGREPEIEVVLTDVVKIREVLDR